MRLAVAAFLALAATLAGAQAQDRASLPGLVAAFVAAERPNADSGRQAAISACIIEVFDGLSDAELKAMIVVDDFEESFDRLLKVYPEREEKIEVCEDL